MTNQLKKIFLVSALAVAATTVSAQDQHAEIHVGGGRTLFGESLDDATHGQIGIGYSYDRWSIELMASEYNTDIENSDVEVRGTQFRIDQFYHFSDGKWRPYISYGAGRQRLHPEGGDISHQTMLNLGVGFKARLAQNWEWRTEVRAFNSIDEHFTDTAFTTGISFLFGHKGSRPAPTPAPVQAPVDPDSDGDGVPDSRDKCPDTPRRYKVDSDGCPQEMTESVSTDMKINFDFDSDVVKEEFYPEVRRVAEFMNQYLNTRVTIEGHTDSIGTDSYNKALSQRRADAVRNALIQRMNIEPERVTAVGYGEERPVADNSTDAGRAANRRVVAEISTDVTRKVTK